MTVAADAFPLVDKISATVIDISPAMAVTELLRANILEFVKFAFNAMELTTVL